MSKCQKSYTDTIDTKKQGEKISGPLGHKIDFLNKCWLSQISNYIL